MHGKVYIERVDGGVNYAETDEKNRLIRYLNISDDEQVGRIYRGKVERVTSAGSFVDIGRNLNGFLSDVTKKPGDFVTVQVARDEVGNKGCLLTEKLSLQGKFVVVTNGEEVRFSRKSKLSEELKKNLISAVKSGVIFRTAFDEKVINSALAEIAVLRENLKKIEEANNLYNIELLQKTDATEIAENMSAEKEIVYSFDEIREDIKSLSDRRVLADGIELVIDKTEAMTVIDINSHLNVTKYADEDSFAYASDIIAAEEVCRQIRLRNIGGIIAVDFINVKNPEKLEKLKSKLNFLLRNDDVMAKCEFSDKLCVALISRAKRYSSVI